MDWSDTGIDTRGRTNGQIKTLCPKCSGERRHKRDKCLSVNLSAGTWLCHHCGWKGGLGKSDKPILPRRYVRPKYTPSPQEPHNKLLAWFAERGIQAEVVRRNKIELRKAWMPQTGKEEVAIAFPYFQGGEVVNVKYRTKDKAFRMEKDAELILYGVDDLESDEPIYFVEGEIDKLSLETVGITNCVSVPNGAGTNLDILTSAEDYLASATKIVIAGDSDSAGAALEGQLIRRLGKARCWRVQWPDDCKDANDVLVKHGAEALRLCLESAMPVPIEGAFEIHQLEQDILNLYLNGRPNGVDTGWKTFSEHYRPRLGDWTVITGSPGSGKSSFLAALMVNLAVMHGWQFVVFPPENMPPEEYASVLIELYVGAPFNRGPNPRMTEEQLQSAIEWADKHFVILNPVEGERNLDGLLALGQAYVYRRGIHGFVIDPFNELEHIRPAGMSETEYICQCLIKFRNFCRNYAVHGWIVAHPVKLTKKEDGKYPVATLYDISGSAHWFNKPDMGLSIWRDKEDESRPVEIHIQKVRFRWCGQLGMVEMYYDTVTGQYSEEPGRWIPVSHGHNRSDDYGVY